MCQFPDLVLRLLDAGERVAAFESDADWFDIGTVGEYERAAADVERDPEKYGLEPVPVADQELLPAMDILPRHDGLSLKRAARKRR